MRADGLDAFVADDEIEARSPASPPARARLAGRRGRSSRALARRTFVLLVQHVQRAHDVELLVRGRDLIQHAARRTGLETKAISIDVAFDQAAGPPARLRAPRRGVGAGVGRRGVAERWSVAATRAKRGDRLDPRIDQDIERAIPPARAAGRAPARPRCPAARRQTPRSRDRNCPAASLRFARAFSANAVVAWRRRDWNSLGAIGATGSTRVFSSSLSLFSSAA